MNALPPRLVVAAPASGHGKTTVATGMLAAYARRGLRVSPHKVGPDYIDPGYHALAAGRTGRNLDPFLCGPERVVPLFLHGVRGADVAVIEGVMGLFDGAAGRGGFASTAHVARLLAAPVVLVVDAAAQGRSIAALVGGFVSYDRRVRIGGVILNRVGSDRHEAILREALAEAGFPVLGVLRRHAAVAAPSRHLGLVPVAERRAEALRAVRDLGELVAAGVDLDAVLALARSASPLPGQAWDPYAELAAARGAAGGVGAPPRAVAGGDARARPRIAVAGGAAFTFSYAENVELLTAAGADVVTVDPLRDRELPERTAGLVLGGGFPEVFAAELSGNEPLRARIADFAAAGGAIAAECAGLLYLARGLDGAPMCGVLGADAVMSPRLTLGYREAVAPASSALAAAGMVVHGHEFHRTLTAPAAGPVPAWRWHPGMPGAAVPGAEEWTADGFVAGRVHASYLHLHWAGAPALAARSPGACARAATPGLFAVTGARRRARRAAATTGTAAGSGAASRQTAAAPRGGEAAP